MSNSTQNETHNVCNERLAKEGGQARCCDCEPHEGCTLGMKPTKNKMRNAGICISCGKPMIVPANQMAGLKHEECEQPTQNDWEKRFEKHYGDYGDDDFGSCSVECELRMENIKKFIAKELADARKEVYREIAGHFIKICGDDVLATLKEERV